VWLSARGSRCCSRNVLLNTLLEDGHGGSVGPNSSARVILPPLSSRHQFGCARRRIIRRHQAISLLWNLWIVSTARNDPWIDIARLADNLDGASACEEEAKKQSQASRVTATRIVSIRSACSVHAHEDAFRR